MPRNSAAPAVAGFDLVIFDCDGVLVDSEMLSCRAGVEALAGIGYVIEPERFLDRFTGMSDKDAYAVIERELGRKLPAGLEAEIARQAAALFERELRPIPGIEAVLAALALPKCVASSSVPASLAFKLRHTGLLSRFGPAVFSSVLVARGKPAPDLFLHAAERMGASPERCLVVEDSTLGIVAAKAAGMTAFGFTGGSHCRPDHGERLLAAGADLVFAEMHELPRLVASSSACR